MNRTCWRGATALLVAFSCWLAPMGRASAAQQVSVGANPWLDVQLQSGTLTVNTWDRPDVQISSAGHVDVRHVDAATADQRLPRQYTAWSENVPTQHGIVRLPEESFALPQLQGSSHDAVVASGSGDTTITVPRGTALVTARVGTGQLKLNNYRGAFITQVRNGGIALDRVSGSGYAQALSGPIDATNSTFDRLRVRTATGNMMFRGCTSHQIEATSKYGSIVYDNGKFQPGLARFESEHGNVALGVRGGAQIGAHSGTGHVVSTFHDNNASRPVVTAVSKHGSVFLYNGSAGAHPRMREEMRNGFASTPRNYTPARNYAPGARTDAPAANGYAPARNYTPPGYGRRFNPQQQQQQYAPPAYPPQRQAPAYQPQRQGQPPQAYPQQRQGPPSQRQGPPPQQGGGGGGGRRHDHQPPA